MGVRYTLTCSIDQRWVQEWGGSKSPMRFCFGTSVSDNPINVVAYVDDIESTITIQWETDYYIAAGRKSCQAGENITTATDWASIDFGQKYTIDRSWLNTTPTNSDQAPEDGFFFQNVNTPAVAILANKINGKISPFYISPVLLPPAGKEGGDTLVPSTTVAVWFQMNVASGSMIDTDSSQKYMIRMRSVTAQAYFNHDGNWGPTPPDGGNAE